MASRHSRIVLKPLVFILCLGPLAYLVSAIFQNTLGVEPIEALNRALGDWALRLILLTLAIRPIADITGLRQLIAYRRMIGLFAYFYVVMHVSNYLVVDLQFDWPAFGKDIVKRNYITVGMFNATLLTLLALTSTKGMIKRMGGRRWRRLHSLLYPISMLAVLHFFMMTKADFREPAAYAVILAILLGYRAAVRLRRDAKRRAADAATVESA